MDANNQLGYKPPPEFKEYAKDPLVELSLGDSTELWLIQWPINQVPDFDGQELTLKLHHDGQLGSFQGSSGKSYDVVSFASQEPDATVFVSSKSESKVVGKISRRVSLIHYPEPQELQQHQSTKSLKHMYQKSSGTSLTTSHLHGTPRGIRPRNSQSMSGFTGSTHSSRHKSSLSEFGEPSKPRKKRNADDHAHSMDQSTQDSGRGHSAITSSGSLGHSNERKSKKRRNNGE